MLFHPSSRSDNFPKQEIEYVPQQSSIPQILLLCVVLVTWPCEAGATIAATANPRKITGKRRVSNLLALRLRTRVCGNENEHAVIVSVLPRGEGRPTRKDGLYNVLTRRIRSRRVQLPYTWTIECIVQREKHMYELHFSGDRKRTSKVECYAQLQSTDP